MTVLALKLQKHVQQVRIRTNKDSTCDERDSDSTDSECGLNLVRCRNFKEFLS